MKIYLDYIFFINTVFDFLLLLSVSIILKRNVKLRRIIIGSIIGGLSIFILFIKVNNFELFLIKFIISVFMLLITFGYKNMKYMLKNISYLYMSSMVLGGALYFLNIEFSYNKEGLIFYHNGFSINLIVLAIISPIIVYTYIKQSLGLKNNYSNYCNLDIKYKEKNFKLTAFLDTGNRLIDPMTKRPVIVVLDKYFKDVKNYIYVPYNTISNTSILKCIKADEIKIDGKKIQKKFLIGLVNKIDMEGIDCILNPILVEEK